MLTEQTNFWGAADIKSIVPGITVHHDVVYHPTHPQLVHDADLDWGIYSSIGERVEEAASRRGPSLTVLGQSLWKPFPVYEARRAPDPSYIYGGIIIPHYGHFICSSLSRLWYPLEKSAEKSKVLFHAPSRVGTNPPGFILEFLSAAGLPPDRVVVFERPTWVQRLVIPAPAMIEQSHAHSVARRTFENIGDRLASKRTPKPTAVPIYLSKAALDTGLTRIENEVVLEIELNRLGVEIVYPEKLSIRAQVDLFRSSWSIIGFTSSAFHTSAFAGPSGKRIIISFEGLNSNQLLIDRLTHPNSTYITPPPRRL